MLIKYKHAHKRVILPVVGEVELNPEDNTVEVEEELAQLLAQGADWEIVEQSDEEEDTDDGEGEEDEDDGEEDTEGDDETTEEKAGKKETEDVAKELSKMSLKELKALAKEGGIKIPNVFSNDVKKLRGFLAKKIG